MAEQDHIGWKLFMEGCISTEWKGIQQTYFRWLGRRNTGRRWAELLITKLLGISWDMWDHRNRVRHAPNNPRQRKARSALDAAVTSELQLGRGILPTSLWYHFDYSIPALLAKPTDAKKNWLQLIEAGRRFALAQALGLPSAEVSYRAERDALRYWLSTG